MQPSERWKLQTEDGDPYQEIRSYQVTRQIKAKRITRLHYMAFCEETQNGEPHLHILLRTAFVPQRWISQQMKELINSPVVWIEKIKGSKSAIAYVTKYVTDAPAQFGKSRRYWTSRFYQIKTRKHETSPIMSRQNSALVRQSFRDLIAELLRKPYVAIPMTRTMLRLVPVISFQPKTSADPPFDEHPDLLRSYIWLRSWQQRLKTV